MNSIDRFYARYTTPVWGQNKTPKSSPTTLADRVSQSPPPVAEKVQKTPPVLGLFQRIRIWFKRRSAPAAGTYAAKIEHARMDKLYSVLNLELSGPHQRKKLANSVTSIQCFNVKTLSEKIFDDLCGKGPFVDGRKMTRIHRECVAFAKSVIELRDLLVRTQNGTDFTTTEEVQEMLCEIAGTKFYQDMMDKDNEAVNFLQYLGHKLRTADGSPIYQEFARKELGVQPSQNGHSMGQLGADLLHKLKNPEKDVHTRDNKKGTAKWVKDRPGAGAHSAWSGLAPLRYNSFQDNSSTAGYKFTRTAKDGRKKTMRFLNTPGITGDKLYEFLLLPLYKKLNMHEVRFNYQDMSEKPEQIRIQEVERIAGKSEGHFHHVVLGHNTKIKKNAAQMREYENVDQFIDSQRDYIVPDARELNFKKRKEDNGYKIPTELLTDKQLEGIFAPKGPARTLFKDKLDLDGRVEEGFDKADRGLGMQYGIDGMITGAIVHNAFDLVEVVEEDLDIDEDLRKGACYITGACKQNYDRAPGHNFTTYAYHRSFETAEPLSDAEILEGEGTIMGRARINDHRNPQIKHVNPAFNHFLDLGDDGTKHLSEVMQAYRDEYLTV